MAGYTRQATANIQTGKVIYAEDINAEYNALAAAFSGSTGHSHDGSTGNGPKINLVNSVEGVLPLAMGGTGASNASGARTAIGAHNASNLTAGTLPNGRLSGSYSFGSLTLSGSLTANSLSVNSSTGFPVSIERTGSAAQTSVVLTNDGGSVTFGNRGGSTFSIGSGDLTQAANRWFNVSEGVATATGDLAVEGTASAGSFSGDGSGLTNLNASAVSTGTLPANRLPNHSAALLTSGTLPSGRLSGNYSFGSLTLSGDLNLTNGPISGDAASIETNPGGWIVRTGNNSADYILSVQSSGGAERFKVMHGAPLLQGSNAGWSVDGAFTATTISGTLSGNGSGITNLNASNVSSGTLNASRIPNLNASKVTSGAFHVDRIPALPASKVTSGTFSTDRIPSLNASILGSGTLPAARLSGNYSFGSLTLSGSLTASSVIEHQPTTANGVSLGNRSARGMSFSNRNDAYATWYLNRADIGTGFEFRTHADGESFNTVATISNSGEVSASSFSGSFSGNGSGITNLNGSNVSSGTVAAARIANLPASKITSGTFSSARIPNLSASILTSGTLPNGRLSGDYSFGSLTLSGSLTASGSVTAGSVTATSNQGAYYGDGSTITIAPASGNSSGRTVQIRPRGSGTSTNQTTFHNNGNVELDSGRVIANGFTTSYLHIGSGSGGNHIHRTTDDSQIILAGGTASNSGANVRLFGPNDGAGQGQLRDGSTTLLRWVNGRVEADNGAGGLLPVATVSQTSANGTTSFPIGHVIWGIGRDTVNRNASATVRASSDNSHEYDIAGGSGTVLSGTWRSRGRYNNGNVMQRTA